MFLNAPLAFGVVLLVFSTDIAATVRADGACSCTPEWVHDLSVPGFNGHVYASAEWNGELFVGGWFSTAGGVPAKYIARWNDSAQSWQALSGGVNGYVYALAVYNGVLYVAGNFDLAFNGSTEVKVRNIARWDGSWHPVHDPFTSSQSPGLINGSVEIMLIWNGQLYIGGSFDRATRSDTSQLTFVRRVASFNGETFAALDDGLASIGGGGNVNAMAVYNDALYIGGDFDLRYQDLANCGPLLSGIARWSGDPSNGYSWSPVSGGIWRGFITCGNNLFVGLGGSVKALAVYPPFPSEESELYAAGWFTWAGGQAIKNIARWNEVNEWRKVDDGVEDFDAQFDGEVNSLEVWNDHTGSGPCLYVGGDFSYLWPAPSKGVNGIFLNNIARWNGACWSGIPGPSDVGTSSGVLAMLVHYSSDADAIEPGLVVAGRFLEAGGLPAGRIARLKATDVDHDQVPTNCDNCPEDFNPRIPTLVDCNGDGDTTDPGEGVFQQLDRDCDGIGDACDPCSCGRNDRHNDTDGVPNACDNCTDTYNLANVTPRDCNGNGIIGELAFGERVGQQCDRDGNGIGDECDIDLPAPRQLLRIKDRAGTTLETFEYIEGRLAVRHRFSGPNETNEILTTTYGYDSGRLSTVTNTPLDGSAGPRSYTLKYDPADPSKLLGTVSGGSCECSPGGRFVYRDGRDRVTQITTAAEILQDTVVLESFEYMENNGIVNGCGPNETNTGDANDDGIIDDRMTAHKRRNEAGVLVEIERRVYFGGPIGPYSVIVCRPSSGQFEVRQEHYDAAHQLFQLDEQDVLQASCADPGSWTASTIYDYYKSTNSEGIVTGETWTTYYPPAAGETSSYRDIVTWTYVGVPFQSGTRVHTTKRVSATGDEVNARTETYEYKDTLGDYRLQQSIDTNGAITTFAYDDPGFPDRVLSETRSGSGGLSFPATTSIKSTFVYDPAGTGRIWKEVRPGPNWTGLSGCSANAEAGCVVSENTYDVFGRLVKRIEDFGTGKLNRVNEYRYNAFDEQIASREPPNLVRARHYNGEGQVAYDYSFSFDGDLNAIGDASQPPVVSVYEHRLYEYHPVSGKTTRERVVLSDSVPITFNATPPLTADTVNTYDPATGMWLQSIARPGLPPTTFLYDEQGRTTYTWSEGGIIRWNVYNGRGFVEFSAAQEGLFVWALLSQTVYQPDGQVAWTRQPNGSYFVHEYDGWGRLSKKKRCDTSACDGEFHYVTTFEYDSAGNVTREYTWDGLTPSSAVADMGTNYDKYGRPYSVRRRATFSESPPVDDDDDSDGMADEVTLTKYNAAGGVEVVAGKLSNAPTTIIELTDQVTKYVYDNLGRLTLTTRVNKDSAGVPVYEYSTRVYEGTTDRVKWECVDAFSCTTSVPILTQRQYDATGQVTKTIDPEGHYIEQFYDSRGHIIRQIGFEAPSPNQRDGAVGTALIQERWKYDNAGRLIQTTRMASAAALPSVDPQPAIDNVVDYTYDQEDRRKTATAYNMNLPEQHTTNYNYDVALMQEVTDPYGNWERIDYQPPLNIVGERTRYDGLSIITVNYQHDGLGRVKSETQGTGLTRLETQFEYDAADRPVVVKRRRADNDYIQTRYAYNLLGRRIAVTEADETIDARTTSFGYDRLGRLTSQTAVDTDPNPDQQQVTLYGYDLVGRRVQSVFPDSINQTSDLVIVEYDAAGRVIHRNAFGIREVILEYDRRGLLISRTLNPDAPTSFYESFNYDGVGRMTEALRVGNDPLGYFSSIVGFGYDDLSNLMSEKQHVLGAGIKFFYYKYDQAGNRLCADCPDTGSPVIVRLDYAYDALNRVAAINRSDTLIANYDYTAGGSGLPLDKRRVQLNSQGVPVDLEYDPAYDEHGRTKGISNNKVASGLMTVLDIFSTPFDGLGNPYYTVRFRDPGVVERGDYTYDSLSRLKLVDYCCDSPPKVENFELDLLGNRDSYGDTRPDPEYTIAYGANNAANEYSSINTLSVSYDASGNLIRNESGYTFDYDPDNRLMQVKDPTGAVMASYAYDALGRRVREVKGGKTTYFYYDGQRVFAEYEKTTPTATATLARYYVDGPMYVDEHVLMHEGGNGPGEGKDFYYLLGPLYNVAGIVDAEGKTVQAYSYDAYGAVETVPAPPTVTAGGGRYLLVTPADQGALPVALGVTGDWGGAEAACFYGYVQSKCAGGSNNGQNCVTDADCPKVCVGGQFPDADCMIATDCPQGDCVGSCDEGTLGPTPFYKLSSQWGTVRVRGMAIRPGTTYTVRTLADFSAGAAFSSAATAATWTWGDVDHSGVVNVLDIANLVNAMKGFWGSFTFEQMNLYGCEPDAVLNALDIALCVDALRGRPFPCAPPTCTTGDIPPPNPYYFTGRRLDFDLRDSTGKPLLSFYDYRAREYDARHGRFLQRDPAGYVDGANLYEYARSNPGKYVDPSGEGVFTLLLLGDYSASDWRFIRDGGLKGVVLAATQGALNGLGNSVMSAGEMGRELAYSAADLALGPLDIMSTLAFGESIGGPLSQLSQAGSNPDSLAEVIADAGSRNVLNAVTLGGFNIVEGALEYHKTGDSRQFSRSVGGQGVLTLAVVGTGTALTAVRGGQIVANTKSCPVSAEVLSGEFAGDAQMLLQGFTAEDLAVRVGGRLGADLTRQHVANVAAELRSRGWTIIRGGGQFPEEYIPGPGRGLLGSSFPDITATKNGRTLRINTIDTYADGITPTAREAANAARIRSQMPGDHLLLVRKPQP